MDQFKTHQPEKYSGVRDGHALTQWLSAYNTYAAVHHIPEDRKIEAFATYLDGEAIVWWEYFVQQRVQTAAPNAPAPLTWLEVVEALKNEFLPRDYERALWNRLHALRQHRSVQEYTSDFKGLLLLLPNINQADLVQRYVRGLKPDTGLEVELRGPATLVEAEQLALRYDDIRFGSRRTQATRDSRREQPRATRDHRDRNYQRNGPEIRQDRYPEPLYQQPVYAPPPAPVYAPVVDNTTRPMELDAVQLQRLSPQEKERLRRAGACFKCRRPGHTAFNCPTRRNQPNVRPNVPRPLPPRPSRQRVGLHSVGINTDQQPGNVYRQ